MLIVPCAVGTVLFFVSLTQLHCFGNLIILLIAFS